ncbi:hypothetical protein [Haliangium ochraceum]|uniref:Cytochrome c domain-containing protein n=1 Tax=Haliangium ochraceum (strain DSM 14365 / JCM 11303 / SMP-2) TaxID=502025 RepID=D0LGD3_HALO1|nr:hypothetical protein [Haliangium ochraceum]ACY18158.1 hypothetical protein Hoch_5681 [Haliangium ochraceum DSM 14365]
MHASTRLPTLLFSLVVLSTAACGPAVPSNPSWEEDVKPIMLANCARCHRDDSQNGAPSNFRLDVCETTGGEDGTQARAERVVARAKSESSPMPPLPASPLTDRQVEVLDNWLANGAPCDSSGAASVALLTPLALRADERGPQLELGYALRDPRASLVHLSFVAESESGELHTAPAADAAAAAEATLRWSLAELPAGSYELRVTLDDGAEIREQSLGSFVVPAR